MHLLTAIPFGLVGAFYMFGSYLLVRTITMDRMIDVFTDHAEGIMDTVETDGSSRFKRFYFFTMAAIGFAAGAFLFVQSAVAPLLFCICLAMQLLHVLYLGPQVFDRDDSDAVEASGRQKTINAAVLYAVVTLVLLIAQNMGFLPSLETFWSWSETAGFVLAIAFIIYTIGLMRMGGVGIALQNPSVDSNQNYLSDLFQQEQPKIELFPVELRIQAVKEEHGLWARHGENNSWKSVQADDIGLSVSLELRLSKWEERYDEFWNHGELSTIPNWTEFQKQQHFDEALAIAGLLQSELHKLHLHKVKVTWINSEGEILVVERQSQLPISMKGDQK